MSCHDYFVFNQNTKALKHIILKVAFIPIAILVNKFSKSIFHVVFKITLISITIFHYENTLSAL